MVEALAGARVPEGLHAMPNPAQVQAWTEETDYSEKYCDEVYEYRRVTVPRGMLPFLPQGRCMEEAEWRSHGSTMTTIRQRPTCSCSAAFSAPIPRLGRCPRIWPRRFSSARRTQRSSSSCVNEWCWSRPGGKSSR